MAKNNALTPLDYCNRAVSTDPTRYNLDVPYRDGTRLVATDGHRLHLVEGLPDTGKGFIDGRNFEFVHYQSVVPERFKLLTVATVHITKKQASALKRLVKTFKGNHCDCVIETDPKRCVLVFTGKYRIGCESVEGGFTVTIPAECERSIKVALNLSYFVDALLSDYNIPGFTIETTEPRSDGTMSAIVLRYDMRPAYIAVIMPLRLEK
jgi:hypothetical protein